MASRHQDPFEGLRLDERFIRGARFVEPSAAERGRQEERPAAGRCQVMPAPRGLPGFFHRLVAPPALPGRSRRIARVVTFVAIVVSMATITVLALRQPGTRGGAGSVARLGAVAGQSGPSPSAVPVITSGLASPPAGYVLTPALVASLQPGDCLLWTSQPVNATAPPQPVSPVRVGCDRPHVDQVTGLVNVSDQFGHWPGASTLAKAADDRCQGSLRNWAGGIDTAPHYRTGVIYPAETSWHDDVRTVVCTIRRDDLSLSTRPLRYLGSIGI